MLVLKNFTGKSDDNNSNTGSGSSDGVIAIGGLPQDEGSSIDPLDMLINYNEKFKNADPILFRDIPMAQMLATLRGKQKPSCLLIGQAGVGKTKLVEDLARMLANNDPLIPKMLRGYTVYELPIANLKSDSGVFGALEKKTKAVLEFAMDKANKAIIFIDEIHQLCNSHGSSADAIAQIMKPALARGDFKCIGATTLQESTKLYSQPAFHRRFSKVITEELTQNQTTVILKNILDSYLKHHDYMFTIADDVLETIPMIADQFVAQGSHRPDNAITLLDRAVSNLITAHETKIVNLQKVAANPNAPESANAKLILSSINPVINITAPQIQTQAIKLMKGGAVKDTVDFDELEQKLKVIQGQDCIVGEMLTLLKREEQNLFPRKKPLTILFAGPSGVGKTEFTKIIAAHMTGKEPITLNMTEYAHSSSVNQIIGSDMGFIGSESNVELPFDCLESNPYQIILLDEFEKGNKAVQRLFMRVFDEGKLKTKRHQELDFSKAIIIATTNAGFSESQSMGFSTGKSETAPVRTLVEKLKAWFDVELLNRFEYIKPFNTLPVSVYLSIINAAYNREIERIRKTRRVSLHDTIDDETLAAFEKGYNKAFGARPAFNLVRDYIEQQV
jgi:ATP-dependent Clp protease ATP-binding subunit ClpA